MKKKNILKIIAILILIIGVLLIGYGTLTFIKNKNKKETSSVQKKHLDINGVEVVNLYNNINPIDKNKCIDITSFMNIEKNKIEISSSIALDIYIINRSRKENTIPKTILLSEVENNIKNLLGKDYNFDIKRATDSCYFEKQENGIIYVKENKCNCNRKVYTMLYDAIKYEDIMEIYEYRLYEEDGKYYRNKTTDATLDIVVNDLNQIEEKEENYSKGNKYKYTLKLENGNYYLENIERVMN